MRKKGSQTTHTTQVASWTKKPWVAYTLAFGIIGAIVLITTHAATGNYFFDVADGTPANGATKVALANTASGSAIKFGAPSSGGASVDPSCKYLLPGAGPAAFCDNFNTPYAGTKTQTGALDPTIWGVSRVGDNNPQNILNGLTVSHNACSGGGTTGPQTQNADAPGSVPYGPETLPPDDVQICNGQLVESINDGGAVANLDMYPKQPFNWAGRTGHVVFDIGNNNTGGHGAWPEFAITDEPVPGVRTCPGCPPPPYELGRAKNELILKFTEATDDPENDRTALTDAIYTVNNSKGIPLQLDSSLFTTANSVLRGSPTAMNHMEIAISSTRLDVYSTEPGGSQLVHIGGADLNLDPNFTQGLVWMNDVHYNARKATNDACDCGATYDHSFAWDNFGFDGPKTYRDFGFDIPLANDYNHARNQAGEDAEVQEGYYVGTGRSFTFTGVTWNKTPAKAKLVLNANVRSNANMSISLNGHTAINYTVFDNTGGWNPISFDFPTSDAVKGNNTIQVTSDDGFTTFANMSLIMVNAADVP